MIVSQATTFVNKQIWSNQECEIKLGIGAKQKQEELEHLNRLLEALQLDKDILTQLKVRKAIFLNFLGKHTFSKETTSGESAGKGGKKIEWKKKMTESNFNIIYSNWHIKQDLKLHK